MKTPLLHLLCALLPLCAAAQIVSDTSASLSTLRHEPMQQWPAEADRTIQRDQADSIDALVDLARARHQLKPGDAEALALLQKALKLEPTHLGAALLLAEVYQSAAGDDAENMKKAERLLKRAVEYHPHAEEGWLRLAQLLEKDLRYDAAIRILADAILLNPTDAEIYRAFIDKSFWYSAESDMIFVLDSLTTLLSYSHPHLIAKAEALFRLNDVQKSKALLDSLRSFIYKDTKTHFYLLDAKVCFELFQDDAGLASYWKAVSAVTDSLDRRHFLHDLCYIMTSEEYANFSAPGDFQRYLALFWRRRDPDLATPANERIAEHYRRVHYARRNFRRYVPDRYNETLLERDHYHAGAMDPNSPDRTATLRNAGSGAWIKHGVEVKVGDDFINTLLSDAIYANRDLDDMGLIYVRHGEWDDWETATIDQYNVLQNRTVQYFQRGTRPEMLFHFVKGGDIRGWCIESLPHYYINRGRFDPRYARIENNAEMNRRSREFEFEE
ncbi:GWxTD domain-containing protein, partial [candidate division KSB1 bacterium]